MNIIAEIGQAHEGSLGMAAAFIRAISSWGGTHVKFQCHIPDAESTPDEHFRPGVEHPQDATRMDYWRRMEFSRKQWEYLSNVAKTCEIQFGCSVFSKEGIDRLDGLVDFWKVPSGEWDNEDIYNALIHKVEPVFISSGFMTDEAVRAKKLRIARDTEGMGWYWLYCVSRYPTPLDKAWPQTRELYHGISDHSGEPYPSIMAACHGMKFAEVHVTWDLDCFGPDVHSSLSVNAFGDLLVTVEQIDKMQNPPHRDETIATEEFKAAYRHGKKRFAKTEV